MKIQTEDNTRFCLILIHEHATLAHMDDQVGGLLASEAYAFMMNTPSQPARPTWGMVAGLEITTHAPPANCHVLQKDNVATCSRVQRHACMRMRHNNYDMRMRMHTNWGKSLDRGFGEKYNSDKYP